MAEYNPKHYKIEKQVKTLSVDEYLDNYVDFEETLTACRACPSYNKNWACPDFNRDYLDFYTSYEKIDLIFVKLVFDNSILKKEFKPDELNVFLHDTLFNEKNKLTDELKIIEKDKNGVYLSAGYCNICKECSKIIGDACRFPNLMRNSIESIGGLVVKISKDIFDTEIKWIDQEGHVPEYLSLLNAVLY